MRKTKIGAGLIALALTVSMTPVRAAQAPGACGDVRADAWYAAPVEFCRRHGLMDLSGADTFDPEGLMTRAVLAEALYRLEGRPTPETPEEAPETPEEAPEAPEEAPEAPEEAPEAPEAPEEAPEAPEAPEEAPEAPEEAPEAPEAPEEAPETPEEAPETPEEASEAPEEASEAPEEASEAPEAPEEASETVPETPETVPETPEAAEGTAGEPEEPAEETPEPENLPFSDVSPDHPSLEAIRWAAQAEIVSGYPDGTFRPDSPITREEIAVLLWNSQSRPVPTSPLNYVDGGDVSDWAADAVAWAQGAGVMVGDEKGRFLPQDNTTRAQGASLLRGCGTRLYGLEDAALPPALASRPSGNQYVNEYFSVDAFGYLSYHGNVPCRKGIDVSSHQEEIDWARVAGAGMDFAMIRAGYRGYTAGSLNKDPYFEYNIQNALANGLDVGVYFFSQALTPQEAEEEAYMLLELVKGYDITYPLVFDWEEIDRSNSRSQGASGETVTACAQVFCKIVSDAGYIPMTYGSPNKIYNGGLLLDQLQDYPAFWLAHYTQDTAPTNFRYNYEMWQYSSTGWVDGVMGNVDLDICLTDWSQWYKKGA